MDKYIEGGALNTNFFYTLVHQVCDNLDEVDKQYYIISAIICGKNEHFRPLFPPLIGGNVIAMHKYYPAYYSMALHFKDFLVAKVEEKDEDDDGDDEDMRSFTAGYRELSI